MKGIIRHIRQSLSLKLSYGILLMSVPIFILSLGILFEQSRRNIKTEAMEYAVSMLNTTTQRVVRHLNTIETATNANDWMVTERLHPDSLLALTNRIVSMNANVSGCSVTMEPNTFPQYGRYFSAYSVRENDSVITVREEPYEYFEKVWYKTPKDLGAPTWVDPFDDYNEGTLFSKEKIASYCKPLYDAQKRFIGVISTDVQLRRLAEIIKAERPFENAYFVMLGKDGRYFVHPDIKKMSSKTVFSGADATKQSDIITLGHEMINGHEGAMQVVVRGEPCLVCYRPVPGTKWSLALVCPDRDILYKYNLLTFILIPLIIFGLVLIFWLCYRIVGHAIRPLNRLVYQSQRLTEGHYDERIPHTDRQDVVGRLQNSFSTMQESLVLHMSEIRKVNTEMAQRNEDIRRASELVEESARQKTLFIQNMTHQIRTPLNIIQGFAQVVRDSIKDLPVEEVKNVMDTMVHNSMTLSRMVQMLYDSSDSGLSEELSSSKYEEVSCNEVARESVEFTYQHFPDLSILFETTVPDTFTIITSRLYLMRSLREILYNSAKYSDGQHISVHVTATDTLVRFIFEDTGSGISGDYYDQMFKPFTKVDDLSEGLGLGLPLAKRHIQNLGGELKLDTDYHDGCRFIIELPINKPE